MAVVFRNTSHVLFRGTLCREYMLLSEYSRPAHFIPLRPTTLQEKNALPMWLSEAAATKIEVAAWCNEVLGELTKNVRGRITSYSAHDNSFTPAAPDGRATWVKISLCSPARTKRIIARQHELLRQLIKCLSEEKQITRNNE